MEIAAGVMIRRYSWRPGLLLSRLTLGLILGGLTTSLLTLGWAALIGHAAIGEAPEVAADPSLSCTAFQVGSPFAANTVVRLENDEPERVSVQLYLVDHEGRGSQAIGYSPVLDPWTSGEFVFRTPPLGAAVTLVSSGRNVRASVEIVRYDGARPEIRKASGCLARSVPRQAIQIIPTGHYVGDEG